MIGCPPTWSDIYETKVKRNKEMIAQFNNFQNLADDASEAMIQERFSFLVLTLESYLGFPLTACRGTPIIVGGILAREEYDIRGQTDPSYMNFDGDFVFATVIKTHESFGEQQMWYHKSRAAQIFSTLFAFNCPTFQLTHRQLKLFAENPSRNLRLTFPYNSKPSYSPHLASTLVQPMGTTLLKAMTICILAKPAYHSIESDSNQPLDSSEDSPDPNLKTIAKRSQNSEKKLYPSRGLNLPNTNCPMFQVGEVQGKPLYRSVRVAPQLSVLKTEGALPGCEPLSQSLVKLARTEFARRHPGSPPWLQQVCTRNVDHTTNRMYSHAPTPPHSLLPLDKHTRAFLTEVDTNECCLSLPIESVAVALGSRNSLYLCFFLHPPVRLAGVRPVLPPYDLGARY